MFARHKHQEKALPPWISISLDKTQNKTGGKVWRRICRFGSIPSPSEIISGEHALLKGCCFLLLTAAGLILQTSYAVETLIPDPEQCVVILGEEAMFVAGTNDLSAWGRGKTPCKYCLTVFDNKGKKAVGYLGTVGQKEELGTELLFDGGMEMVTKKGKPCALWWIRSRCEVAAENISLRPDPEGKTAVKITVVNGKTPWGNHGNLSERIPVKNNRLYKFSGWLKNGPGAEAVCLIVHDLATGKQIMSSLKAKEWKECALYFRPSEVPVPDDDLRFIFHLIVRGADGTCGYGDDLSLREVVSGGKNTAKIYPARTGKKLGWGKVERGFNPYCISKCVVEEP